MTYSPALPVTASPTAADVSFKDLVEQYKRPVYFLALDLTGNHHDAEDLSQDVFIIVYRKLDDFRGDAGLRTWIYRITVNTYLNRQRKKARTMMQLRDDFSAASAYDPEDRPDHQVRASAVQRHLEEALTHLSPRERIAFVLRHQHELPIRDVAAAMGISDGTVKSLLFRAVRKLRKALAFYRADLGLEH